MDIGAWLTRGTVWLALLLYVASQMVEAARRTGESISTVRWLSSVGCAAFLAHVACAFHFYHGWSHLAATAETARRTAEVFGWRWGGGIYFNYLFAFVWIGDVARSWVESDGYQKRRKWAIWIVRSFFWFMMLNGTVVFAHGAARGYGLILCLTLVVCWWLSRKRHSGSPGR